MPSFINELMLKEVKAFTDGANALILVDSSKLKADETLKFRSDLRKLGAKFKIAKCSLVRRALPEGFDQAVALRGTVGVIKTTGDIASAAKLVNELVKEEKVVIKGGLLEGKPLDAKSAARLADLPTREQASAMVVRVLNSPLVQLVRILNAKPTELARVLKVKSEQN